MNKFNFDVNVLNFDIDELIQQLEKEYGRMIVRFPKMERVGRYEYEFCAIFSDFTLLESQMVVIPKFTPNGLEAEIHVQGIYL